LTTELDLNLDYFYLMTIEELVNYEYIHKSLHTAQTPDQTAIDLLNATAAAARPVEKGGSGAPLTFTAAANLPRHPATQATALKSSSDP